MGLLGAVAVAKQDICRHFDWLMELLQQRKEALLREVDEKAADKKAILLVFTLLII